MKRLLITILSVVVLLGMGAAIYYLLFVPHPEAMITSPLQPTTTSTPSTVPSPTVSLLEVDTREIKGLISTFYTAYATCLKIPPLSARGKVSTYCQANTGFTSKDFVSNLAQGGAARSGADPITCSQNPPQSVTGESVDFESPERAVATVVSQSGGFAQKLPVVVVREERVWKVDMVTCPR